MKIHNELTQIIFNKYKIYNLNNIETITNKSTQKIEAECPICVNRFSITVSSLLNSVKKCPYCSNRTISKGFNDLQSQYPQLMDEWDNETNMSNNIDPSEIFATSNKTASWICKEKNHKWDMRIVQRTKGKQNCPFCSNRRLLQGYNDLATRFPKLKQYWGINNSKKMHETLGGAKYNWWICEKTGKHEYSMNIYHRLDRSCPYCSGHKILVGFNDLTTIMSKELLNEWDYAKNKKRPEAYSKGSNIDIWWKCKKQKHSFLTSLPNRIKRGDKCPYCSNKKLLVGFNDLATVYPELSKQWNYEKNKKRPEEYVYGSAAKVWWKCNKGHEWETCISLRNSQKTGCPSCRTSHMQNALQAYIETFNYKLLINDRKLIKPWEIDIVIPELKVGIEFNGDFWHSEEIIQKSKRMSAEKYHITKRNKVNIQGYVLLTVWENDWTNNNAQVKALIEQVLNEIKVNGGIINEKIPDILTKVESDIL